MTPFLLICTDKCPSIHSNSLFPHCMWLVKKGRSKKADKTLHRLRKDYTEEEMKEELNDIEFTILNSNNSLMNAFRDVFKWRILKRYNRLDYNNYSDQPSRFSLNAIKSVNPE